MLHGPRYFVLRLSGGSIPVVRRSLFIEERFRGFRLYTGLVCLGSRRANGNNPVYQKPSSRMDQCPKSKLAKHLQNVDQSRSGTLDFFAAMAVYFRVYRLGVLKAPRGQAY